MLLNINVLDVHSGVRPETDSQREDMYLSVKNHGLLSPLIVAENPELIGRYTVLAGRRRLAACRRVGFERIDCLIKTHDEIQNEIVEITENLVRLELTQSQRAIAIQRYAELYRMLHPEIAGVIKAEANGRATPGQPPSPPRKTGVDRRGKGNASLVAGVAATLGTSKRTAQKVLRRVDAIPKGALKKLEACGATAEQLDKIAAIPDVDKQEAVAELMGGADTRLEFEEAMEEVFGDSYLTDPIADDDAFLESLPLWNAAVNQAKFRADALLYRGLQREKAKFARSIAWETTKDRIGTTGIYFRRLAMFLDCPHPRHWVQCGSCNRGQVASGDHSTCRGGGYLIG